MNLHEIDKEASAFIQQFRRRLSILERSLGTARGDQKSYMRTLIQNTHIQL